MTALNFAAYSTSSPSANDATGRIIFLCRHVQAVITVCLSSGIATVLSLD
ncbi:hypothetical protein [Thermosynechococcus sp.]|nr:hypothetical protein [Thermosynechococcus sp.]